MRAALVVTAAVALGACGGKAFTVSAAPAGDAGGGGGDTDAGSDAGASGFCASKAGTVDFCSDFDEAPLPESWDAIAKGADAQLTTDQTDSVSAPTSVFASTPALAAASGSTSAAPTSSAALVKKNLPKGAAHIQLDLEVIGASFPDTGSNPTGVVVLLLVTVGKDYSLALALRGTQAGPFGLVFIEFLSLSQSQTVKPNIQPLKAAPHLAAWSHVTLDVPAQGSGSVTIHVDQNEAQSFSINPGAAVLSTDRTLTVGSIAQGPVGETKVRFDDVTWSH